MSQLAPDAALNNSLRLAFPKNHFMCRLTLYSSPPVLCFIITCKITCVYELHDVWRKFNYLFSLTLLPPSSPCPHLKPININNNPFLFFRLKHFLVRFNISKLTQPTSTMCVFRLTCGTWTKSSAVTSLTLALIFPSST